MIRRTQFAIIAVVMLISLVGITESVIDVVVLPPHPPRLEADLPMVMGWTPAFDDGGEGRQFGAMECEVALYPMPKSAWVVMTIVYDGKTKRQESKSYANLSNWVRPGCNKRLPEWLWERDGNDRGLR